MARRRGNRCRYRRRRLRRYHRRKLRQQVHLFIFSISFSKIEKLIFFFKLGRTEVSNSRGWN